MKNKCFSEFNMKDNEVQIISGMQKGTNPEYTEPLGITKNVQGKVTDVFGTPLENANVYLRSKSNVGSATYSNGEFEIDNVELGEIIVVSFLGYKPKTFIHKGQYQNIELEPANEELDEVLITNKPKRSYAFAYLLGALAIGTMVFKGKSKSKGLGATKKRNSKTIKFTI